jgi:hypothetical protein
MARNPERLEQDIRAERNRAIRELFSKTLQPIPPIDEIIDDYNQQGFAELDRSHVNETTHSRLFSVRRFIFPHTELPALLGENNFTNAQQRVIDLRFEHEGLAAVNETIQIALQEFVAMCRFLISENKFHQLDQILGEAQLPPGTLEQLQQRALQKREGLEEDIDAAFSAHDYATCNRLLESTDDEDLRAGLNIANRDEKSVLTHAANSIREQRFLSAKEILLGDYKFSAHRTKSQDRLIQFLEKSKTSTINNLRVGIKSLDEIQIHAVISDLAGCELEPRIKDSLLIDARLALDILETVGQGNLAFATTNIDDFSDRDTKLAYKRFLKSKYKQLKDDIQQCFERNDFARISDIQDSTTLPVKDSIALAAKLLSEQTLFTTIFDLFIRVYDFPKARTVFNSTCTFPQQQHDEFETKISTAEDALVEEISARINTAHHGEAADLLKQWQSSATHTNARTSLIDLNLLVQSSLIATCKFYIRENSFNTAYELIVTSDFISPDDTLPDLLGKLGHQYADHLDYIRALIKDYNFREAHNLINQDELKQYSSSRFDTLTLELTAAQQKAEERVDQLVLEKNLSGALALLDEAEFVDQAAQQAAITGIQAMETELYETVSMYLEDNDLDSAQQIIAGHKFTGTTTATMTTAYDACIQALKSDFAILLADNNLKGAHKLINKTYQLPEALLSNLQAEIDAVVVVVELNFRADLEGKQLESALRLITETYQLPEPTASDLKAELDAKVQDVEPEVKAYLAYNQLDDAWAVISRRYQLPRETETKLKQLIQKAVDEVTTRLEGLVEKKQLTAAKKLITEEYAFPDVILLPLMSIYDLAVHKLKLQFQEHCNESHLAAAQHLVHKDYQLPKDILAEFDAQLQERIKPIMQEFQGMLDGYKFQEAFAFISKPGFLPTENFDVLNKFLQTTQTEWLEHAHKQVSIILAGEEEIELKDEDALVENLEASGKSEGFANVTAFDALFQARRNERILEPQFLAATFHSLSEGLEVKRQYVHKHFHPEDEYEEVFGDDAAAATTSSIDKDRRSPLATLSALNVGHRGTTVEVTDDQVATFGTA